MVYKCFATVITGLEQLAECEIRAKLECETQCSGQGRVYFTKDCLDIAEVSTTQRFFGVKVLALITP